MTHSVRADRTMIRTSTDRPAHRPAQEDPMTALAPALAHGQTRPRPASRTAPSRRDTESALLRGPARRMSAVPTGEDLVRRAEQEDDREELRRLRSLAAVVAVACVETEAGRRPVRDLAGWLAPETYEKMCRRVDLLERTGTRPPSGSAPRPVGARVCAVRPGAVEASATVLVAGRARAVALRIERRLSRWKVTHLEIG